MTTQLESEFVFTLDQRVFVLITRINRVIRSSSTRTEAIDAVST
jgi:hypothetical protein